MTVLVQPAEQPAFQIAEYNATTAALADLRQRMSNRVYDVRTTAGMDEAKKDRAEVRGLRTALEAKRVEIKRPALERCRLIDEEAKRITDELVKIEDPIDKQIKAEEKRKADERAAKEEAERQRVAAVRARINAITETISAAVGKPAAYIDGLLNTLSDAVIDESFAEFAAEAEAVQQSTLAKLREMRAAAERHEAEAKAIAEQRAELARQEKEAAERRAAERKQQEEDAARAKAEQDRIAGIRERITNIRLATTKAIGALPAEIDRVIAVMRQTDFASFGEFELEARSAVGESLETLEKMLLDAERREIEAKRQAEERAELERLRADAAKHKITVDLDSTPPAEPQKEGLGKMVNLGSINLALGDLKVTSSFLTSLGFEPAATEKAAKLYRASDFPAMCRAIANYVTARATAEL
jgi:colicin import membrane protein